MPQRILRKRDVSAKTGLGLSTITLKVSQGIFPKPIRLASPFIVWWLESEVDAWIDAQVRATRGEPAPAAAQSA